MHRPETGDLAAAQGQRLGRYRIRGTLGQCGMGRLYVAEQTGIEGFTKIVALKRILPHLAHSPHFRSMFLNEARVAARLEHPNIVTTYELGEVEGIYYIAMEYLPGEDLGAVLGRCRRSTRRRMPVEIAAALAQQALNGLHHAHELPDHTGSPSGLVHRDVNPSNIVITYHGVVKLLDFGLVKERATTGTAPGVFKGKYGYCAPEQLSGDPVDRRTDIFCVGIVLWECLTGRRLFGGLSEAAVIDAVRMQRVLPPSAIRPEVPAELDSITLRALARDRSVRFQSALEMSEVLDRYLSGLESARPTAKTIGLWLEHLFGTERCLLKKAIAQGSQVEMSLQRLASAVAPRTPPGEDAIIEGPPLPVPPDEDPTPNMLPARSMGRIPFFDQSDDVTSRFEIPESLAQEAGLLAVQRLPVPVHDLPPPPIPEPMPPSFEPESTGGSGRTILIGAASGGAVAVAAALIAVMARGEGAPGARPPPNPVVASSPASGASPAGEGEGAGMPGQAARAPEGAPSGAAAVVIDSRPAGAMVFVDGDPVGLTTPATLRGLRPGRPVEVRLEKAGYGPVVRKLDVVAGSPRAFSFELTAVAGLLRVEGIPDGASIYVDDVIADRPTMPLIVPLGRRNVRIERGGQVLWSRTIEIRPGEQVYRVKGPGRGQ